MVEREVVRERPTTEREVVIDDRPPRGGGGGGVVAAIIGIILVLLVGWFLLRMAGIIGEAAENSGPIPEEVEVDVNGGTNDG